MYFFQKSYRDINRKVFWNPFRKYFGYLQAISVFAPKNSLYFSQELPLFRQTFLSKCFKNILSKVLPLNPTGIFPVFFPRFFFRNLSWHFNGTFFWNSPMGFTQKLSSDFSGNHSKGFFSEILLRIPTEKFPVLKNSPLVLYSRFAFLFSGFFSGNYISYSSQSSSSNCSRDISWNFPEFN